MSMQQWQFEYGVIATFSPVKGVGYDYYSRENFITIPPSIPSILGYINGNVSEYNKKGSRWIMTFLIMQIVF